MSVGWPGGGSIAGAWAVIATPDHNTPTTRTVWIRTEGAVLRQDTGLLTTAELEGPGASSIASPSRSGAERAFAVVRNWLSEGASLSADATPFALGWYGRGVQSAAWAAESSSAPEFVSAVAHTGVVQMSGGPSVLGVAESALYLVAEDPALFADGFESQTTGAWSAVEP